MVETVDDPGEERVHLEEDTLLSELIELWIAVEETGTDKLIEDAHSKRGEDGEKDVVEG